ncbi:MAG: hypothetical protein FWE21_01355 [Defluviitaleaceae bacterium]|nr:hypothetical protein [Defluviitaleaceae bacterium]
MLVLLVPAFLLIALAFGVVAALQWLPNKAGNPPPKPMPDWLGILLGIILFSGAIGVVVLIINSRGGS